MVTTGVILKYTRYIEMGNIYLQIPAVAVPICALMLISLHLILWLWLATREIRKLKDELAEEKADEVRL